MASLTSISLFDVVTVACFFVLAVVFFTRKDQSPRILLYYLGFGIVLAVANQIGNHGYAFIAAALVASAAVFAISQALKSA